MPLTPEQQAQVERAAEMLEGYAAHLYKLTPFNPDEHPYIPSIEEAAEEMRALLAQVEAQEAPAKETMTELLGREQVPKAARMAALHAAAPFPVFDMTKHAPVRYDNKATSTAVAKHVSQPLAPMCEPLDHESATPLSSPPSSARQKWETADELCKADPGGMLTYHAEAFDEGSAAALSQPVQAAPDGSLGQKLRNEYECGTAVSDFHGPKITLRYSNLQAAESAFAALLDAIDAAAPSPSDPAQ